MKLAVTIGETDKGWEALALPDVSINDQKKMIKQIKLAHGKLVRGKKDVQLKRVIYFDDFAKRAKFHEVVTPPETVV